MSMWEWVSCSLCISFSHSRNCSVACSFLHCIKTSWCPQWEYWHHRSGKCCIAGVRLPRTHGSGLCSLNKEEVTGGTRRPSAAGPSCKEPTSLWLAVWPLLSGLLGRGWLQLPCLIYMHSVASAFLSRNTDCDFLFFDSSHLNGF